MLGPLVYSQEALALWASRNNTEDTRQITFCKDSVKIEDGLEELRSTTDTIQALAMFWHRGIKFEGNVDTDMRQNLS